MRFLKRTIYFQSLGPAIWLPLLLFASLCTAADDTQLRVEVSSIRSNQGYILISVFTNDRGWPTRPALALRVAKVAAKRGSVLRAFSGLKPGSYAVAVIHDENDNRKLDRASDGNPTEGYGFSSVTTVQGRAATFQEASLEVSSPSKTIKIRINYPSAK